MRITTADIEVPAALVYRTEEHLLILRTGLLTPAIVTFLDRLLSRI